MAIFAMNIVALSPVLARLTQQRGLSESTAGLLFTCHFAGFVILALAGAAIASRLGKKRVITLALLGFAAGFLLFSIVDAFWAECLIMFALGGFGGIVECLSAALASDLDPDRPEQAVNRLQIWFSAGAVVSPLLVSLFLEYIAWWKAFYILLAALSAAAAFALRRTAIASEGGDGQALRLRDLPAVFKERGFLLMCLCMAAYTGSEVGAWGWLSSLLQGKMAFTVLESGLVVSLFWLAMTLGRAVSAALLPRLGARRLVLVMAAFSAAVTLAMVYVSQPWMLIAAAAGIGLGCASQFPLIAGRGSRMTALPSGAAFTVLMVSGNVGGMVVPLGMGTLGAAIGLDKSLLAPVALFALVAVVMLFYKKEGLGKG